MGPTMKVVVALFSCAYLDLHLAQGFYDSYLLEVCDLSTTGRIQLYVSFALAGAGELTD